MKTKLSFLFFMFLLASSCKKEKAETKPKLKLLTVQTQNVQTESGSGITLDIDLEVLDKENDVRDSVFILKRDAAVLPCSGNNKTLFYNIPVYPDETSNKIILRLKFATLQLTDYVLLGGSACPGRGDTSVFKIWVKDKAGNRSDTVTTERIAL